MGPDQDKLTRRLKTKTKQTLQARDSLLSCRTDDKCYCSVGEQSTTTWCDTDSCVSTTKCYCKHKPSHPVAMKKAGRNCIANSLALDYELFTVNNCNAKSSRKTSSSKGRTQHVHSHEALSVKKSVEMAAVFADVKLSQTTDITNLAVPTSSEDEHNLRNARNNHNYHKRDSVNLNQVQSLISSTRSKSKHIPNVLDTVDFNPIYQKNFKKLSELYQTITPKVVSSTLENSLGYLP